MSATTLELLIGNWLDQRMEPQPHHLFAPSARYVERPSAICGARPRRPRECATFRVQGQGAGLRAECPRCLSRAARR